MYEGMFTQPGEGGIFGGDGVPEDASNPVVDADDNPLRETLIVAYPSPGHMRVARATFDARSGRVVEVHEQYREPAVEEVEFLKRKGVIPSQRQQSQQNLGALPDLPNGPRLPPLPGDGRTPVFDRAPSEKKSQPWVKMAVALTVGVAGFWAINKFVVPRISGGGKRKRRESSDAEE